EMPVVDPAGVAGTSDAENDYEDPEGHDEAHRVPEPDAPRRGLGALTGTLNELRRKGFHRLYVNGRTVSLDDLSPAEVRNETSLKVIVDRVKLEGDMQTRLTDSIETAYREAGGTAFAIEDGSGPTGATGGQVGNVHVFSERFECQQCKLTYEAPQPRLFSFNNPFGAC